MRMLTPQTYFGDGVLMLFKKSMEINRAGFQTHPY
jgi:hypothetical protein